MNLLPKTYKEFGEKDYWNKFFKNRGNKAFEWYGEYLELCAHLHKYIKQTDKVLIPGCGNSSLSSDLYDVGYKNIINIDVSEVVIKQMKAKNAHRTDMSFLHMDALNTTFNNDEFNVVLDKGTLDALMPDDSTETLLRIDSYFSEIKRLLKLGGRFICISLLQGHILSKLIDFFCDKSWLLRIVRCHEAEEKSAESDEGTTLPVFIVVATKFKECPRLILEVCMAGEKMQSVQSTDELKSIIKSVQDTAFVTNGLAKADLDEDDEVCLDLMQPGDTNPRYTLFIINQKKYQTVNKYAVFIVPQGRQCEWLFGTPAGRRQLQDSARFGRLVVACLNRGHQFPSLDAVKDELAHAAKMLMPNGFSGQIPFLSLGDVGSRSQVWSGESCSGPYVVEDVSVDGILHRRLVFLHHQGLVQSEARLKTVKRKNKSKLVVDFGAVSLYHSIMTLGLHLNDAVSGEVAVLGLGGGGLCMFIKKCYDDVKVTAVEIDADMLDVAREYFELEVDERLEVQVKDGLQFLQEEANAGKQYSCVMYDMDSKQHAGVSCPPEQFLEEHALELLVAVLGTGQFILNFVCRDKQIRESTLDVLKKYFKYIATVQLETEVNEIIFATNGDRAYDAQRIEAAVTDVNQAARQRKLVKLKCIDMKDVLDTLSVVK
ncbi:CGI-01 protein [Danaus plexippus plexippus]|uniref:CGI-01 protein n=1 Tax=Danaus plexippus plexippus TaxID=278856 RepID=A0A212EJ53_DANPL|nr:CGI-01 protein [Danaus plexippus plexippus]